MTVDLDCIGRRTNEVIRQWTADDALLYAVGVGAGQADPTTELEYTTENSAGHPQRLLPTYAAVLAGALPPVGEIDYANFFHAGQRVDVFAELPVAGRVRTYSEITAVSDKRSGALLVTEAPVVDDATGALLAKSTSSFFFRRAGGFSGTASSAGAARSTGSAGPDGAGPDVLETIRTSPGQALIYRLSGDRNRLHSDPELAASAGFTRPILHGLCTYGMVGRTAIRLLRDRGRELTSLGVRFSSPVRPGQELTLRGWYAPDCLHFEVVTDEGAAALTGGVAGWGGDTA
ncbi:MAG: MaoC/PaaZ C-terminal domain-containing protein [Trebonia sp.]